MAKQMNIAGLKKLLNEIGNEVSDIMKQLVM